MRPTPEELAKLVAERERTCELLKNALIGLQVVNKAMRDDPKLWLTNGEKFVDICNAQHEAQLWLQLGLVSNLSYYEYSQFRDGHAWTN